MLRSRTVRAALVVLAVLAALGGLPENARAAEKIIGTACTSDANAFDWDAGAQCSGATFARAPLILGTVANPPYASTACDAGKKGMLQWTGSAFQGCDGISWGPLGGGAWGGSVNDGAGTSVDWSTGNTHYTSASCGAFTFSNMQDGGTYQLLVKGITSGTCSFAHAGLTFRMPSNHGATTNGAMTVYSFIRAGTDVFVSWIPGY